MAKSRGEHSDVERARRWKRAMVDDLGPQLRQCLRWMHSEDSEGLTIVLASMRRCCVPEAIQQGTSLYWHMLTMWKRRQLVDCSETVSSELGSVTPP